MAKKVKTKVKTRAQKVVKKKKKYSKSKNGKGWNKQANMSNNAVLAFRSGLITWNLFDKRLYFLGEEVTVIHNFISQLFIRHHIGAKMKETYMFPPHILQMIDSSDPMWIDFRNENIQFSEDVIDIKQIYEFRQLIINNLIEKISKLDKSTSIEEVYKLLNSARNNLICSLSSTVKYEIAKKWANELITSEIKNHNVI